MAKRVKKYDISYIYYPAGKGIGWPMTTYAFAETSRTAMKWFKSQLIYPKRYKKIKIRVKK